MSMFPPCVSFNAEVHCRALLTASIRMLPTVLMPSSCFSCAQDDTTKTRQAKASAFLGRNPGYLWIPPYTSKIYIDL